MGFGMLPQCSLTLLVVVILTVSCEKSDDSPKNQQDVATTNEAPPKDDSQPPAESAVSWTKQMEGHVKDRCVSCHSQDYAIADVKLTSYEEWLLFAERSMKRIEFRTLQVNLPEDIRELFLKWREAGYPK